MWDRSAFTLVELLVVIAIIGILSSVAIVNLGSARQKARASNAHTSLTKLSAAIIECMYDSSNLTYSGSNVCDGDDQPVAGQTICNGSSATWPALPEAWIYLPFCLSDASANPPNWFILACDTACLSGQSAVVCTRTGCTISTLTADLPIKD